MADFLYAIDRSLFYFINHTLQNPFFDAVMPTLTDLNKQPVALVIVGALWLLLLLKGGRNGRIAALLLIPAIFFSDQLNSSFLKHLFDRLRPCHVLPDVNILVPCGSGYSFPSSHAVNNFAAAVVLAYYLPKGRWWFYAFAAAMAFSRPYVGAHYPSDVLVGSLVGIGCGAFIILLYSRIEKWWQHRRKNAVMPEESDVNQPANISLRSGISLAVLSGTLLGISFPPSPLYSAAYVALVPFLFLFERLEKYKQVVLYTYVMTFVFHLFSLYWIGGFTHGRDPYLMASGAAVAILHPAFYLVITIPYFFIRKHGGVVLGLISFPFLWISFDYLHSLSEFSFPWVSLGNSQAYDLYRIQLAEYASSYGPALVVLLFNVLAFVLLVQLASKSWKLSSRLSLSTIFALLLVYLLPLFYGRTVVNNREISDSENRVAIGIVQPNIDPWEKWGQGRASKWEYYQQQVALLVEQSKELAERGAELIIWPETAIPYEILSSRYDAHRSEFTRQVDSLGIPVFTGLPVAEVFDSANAPVSAVRILNSNAYIDYYNAATLFTPGEGPGAIYKKIVLVPFAERVPFADALSFLIEPLKWSVGISGWGKGEDQTVYAVRTKTGETIRFSGMICYESIYPDFVRQFVGKGAQFLVIITNDSWWGNTSGAYQHVAFASLRAIENRRWVVQSANGGVSSYIDPLGKVHLSTEMYTPAALVDTIAPSQEMTFYTRNGDIFAQLCLFCSILLLIISVWKKTQNKTEIIG